MAKKISKILGKITEIVKTIFNTPLIPQRVPVPVRVRDARPARRR